MNKTLADLTYHKAHEMDQCVSPVPNPAGIIPQIAPQAELIFLFGSYARRNCVDVPHGLQNSSQKKVQPTPFYGSKPRFLPRERLQKK